MWILACGLAALLRLVVLLRPPPWFPPWVPLGFLASLASFTFMAMSHASVAGCQSGWSTEQEQGGSDGVQSVFDLKAARPVAKNHAFRHGTISGFSGYEHGVKGRLYQH
jgi:hypothetical protein